MTEENAISILKIVVSAIVAFLTAYGTVIYRLKKERGKGKIIILELIKRYFISIINSFDHKTLKVKKDNLSRLQHLRIIERVEQDLLQLQNNLFYTSTLEKYPRITKAQITLSREIENIKANEQLYLDGNTIKEFYNLYLIIRSSLPKKVLKNEHFKEIASIIEELYEKNKQHFEK